jgi:hypothetical protein
MNEAQHAKWVNLLTDQTKDNDTFTAVELDTKGFSYLEIAIIAQNVPANVSALKVQEADALAGGGGVYADVTGLVVGTSLEIDGTTSSLPAASGGDDTITLLQIDLRDRKRYLTLVATAGDGSGTHTEITAVARLTRAEQVPITAAGMGASQVLRV